MNQSKLLNRISYYATSTNVNQIINILDQIISDLQIELATLDNSSLYIGNDVNLFPTTNISVNRLGIDTTTRKIYSFNGSTWNQVVEPVSNKLLDTYTNAAFAYSLRKLRNAYTGAAIRVRRSSDNTEQDINFVAAGTLDTTALLSFVGAGNGFVTTWYDQTTNARNATQSTAANQPQIVISGSLILQNSKPCIDFDGGNDTLRNLGSTILLRERSFVFVGFQDVTQQDAGIISFRPTTGNDYNNNSTFCFTTTNNFVTPKRAFIVEGSTSASYGLQKNGTGSDVLAYGLYIETKTAGEGKLYQNGTLQATDTSFTEFAVSNAQAYNLGSRNFNSTTISNYFNGKFQEFIYWEVNNISNRTGIETNINGFYNIY